MQTTKPTLQERYEKLLSFAYGDKERLISQLNKSIERYKGLDHPRAEARVLEYQTIVKKAKAEISKEKDPFLGLNWKVSGTNIDGSVRIVNGSEPFPSALVPIQRQQAENAALIESAPKLYAALLRLASTSPNNVEDYRKAQVEAGILIAQIHG